MNKTIILKYKTVQKVHGQRVLIGTYVKNGKKIEAKIYPPNPRFDGYKIEMSGCAFYWSTLELALEFVRQFVENRMNAFSNGINIPVTMVKG